MKRLQLLNARCRSLRWSTSPTHSSTALNTRANILASRGRRDEAELLLDGALRFANSQNVDTDILQTIQVNLASVLEEGDQLEACLEHYQQSEMLAERMGDRVGAVFARLTRANALLELGRWDEYAGAVSRLSRE